MWLRSRGALLIHISHSAGYEFRVGTSLSPAVVANVEILKVYRFVHGM